MTDRHRELRIRYWMCLRKRYRGKFFLIGQKITEQSEYLIRRAYDMGCSIENHSKTHPGMPELNDREILDEVSYTTEQIVRITGENRSSSGLRISVITRKCMI